MRRIRSYCLIHVVAGGVAEPEVQDTRALSRPSHRDTCRRDTCRTCARGAVTCFARWGTTKTTLDDVAREAGVSRATLYASSPAASRL